MRSEVEFQTFCDSISAPSLKAVAIHWNEARESRMMPSWTDIRPRAIAKQLSIVWSFKYDHDSDSFTCRLAGERISRFFGKNLRGVSLIEVQPPEAFEPVHALLTRIVQMPATYRGAGQVFRQRDHYTAGERIILPLSSDGEFGDGILGATEYQSPYPIKGLPVETFSENESWFQLSPGKMPVLLTLI